MNQQLKKRLWLVHHFFAVLFGIALVCSLWGCSIPLYRVEITPTTPLTQEEVNIISYQYALKHSPERILAMPTCQWQAMQEYFRLKEEGREACILIGRSNGWGNQKHLHASALKNGVSIDPKGMQVTHILTESAIYRVSMSAFDHVAWQDNSHDQWLMYGR